MNFKSRLSEASDYHYPVYCALKMPCNPLNIQSGVSAFDYLIEGQILGMR